MKTAARKATTAVTKSQPLTVEETAMTNTATANAAKTVNVAKPATKARAKPVAAPVASPSIPTILTGMNDRMRAYNGRACTEVQLLPFQIGHQQLVLVRVHDFEKLKLQEFVAVYESNLTSPSRAAKAEKELAKMTKVRDEIVAYLIASGLKQQGKDRDTLVTSGRDTRVMVMFEDVKPGEDYISIYVEVYASMSALSPDSMEDTIEVSSLKEFKKQMKNIFKPLVKYMADKEFLEVVRFAEAVSK
jgi:hypothetical protein